MEKDMHKRNKEKDSSEGSESEPDEEYDSSAAGSDVSDDLMEPKKAGTSKKADKEKDGEGKKKEKTGKKRKEKDGEGKSGGAGDKKERREKGTKRKKDPNAPKRNQVRPTNF